ncbi:MAG: hypothetical protein AABW41_05545 [Nanoarchaeota archaeon]
MKAAGKELRKQLFEVIQKSWPIHISGLCRELDIKESVSNISKLRYHIQILKKNNLIHTKKIDRALVSWPIEMEKLRVMHEFLNDIH